MWNEDISGNNWLSALVGLDLKTKIRNVFYHLSGTCHKILLTQKKHAGYHKRSHMYPVDTIHTISEKYFPSIDKAHKFLREMKKSSKCNCLPDCELFDIQHSVSTTNFMWVILCMLSVSSCVVVSFRSKGRVTRATWTWTPSACWRLEPFLSFGQTGWTTKF